MTAEGQRSPEELNLAAGELYQFITNDFECAWKALAAAPELTGRGNMIFARQAMSLLELALRLCASGDDPAPVREFSAALKALDPHYFTVLPGTCPVSSEFQLPYDPDADAASAASTLLAALFDLVRHGLAHQYQTITVELPDARVFAVSTSGVGPGEELGTDRRPKTYLGYFQAGDALLIRFFPDVLYLDVKDAIARAKLLERGLSLDYLRRPRDAKKHYAYARDELEAALRKGGHPETPPPQISAATKAILGS